MSDSDASGFAKFVPGFDFLQNLAKGAGASVPHMPGMGNWVAPTLNVEELDKRIEELKNVQFWLEQNSRALTATIQALEVQRMTLVTLKSMNFNLNDLASAFQVKASEPDTPRTPKPTEKPAPAATPTPEPETPSATAESAEKPAKTEKSAGGLGDPLQLWSALTQQFQQIAANALQEVTTKAGIDLSRKATGATAKGTAAAKTAAKKAPAKKAAARKATPRKAPSR